MNTNKRLVDVDCPILEKYFTSEFSKQCQTRAWSGGNFESKCQHCSSIGEFIRQFHLPKLGGTYTTVHNTCHILLAVTHSFEVTDRHLSETLRDLIHMF
jgi:hypothetical protein